MKENVVCLGFNTGLIKFIELDKMAEFGEKYRPAEIIL
jgi:hypothetical protein